MTDREYQLDHLDSIFHNGSYSPLFKHNPKYPVNAGDALRIAYDDVISYNYVIRKDPSASSDTCWSEESEIVADYDSLQELVDDGWRLD
jgi:hypothetical protein